MDGTPGSRIDGTLRYFTNRLTVIVAASLLASAAVACQGEVQQGFLDDSVATNTVTSELTQVARADATATESARRQAEEATRTAQGSATASVPTATPTPFATSTSRPSVRPTRPLPPLIRPTITPTTLIPTPEPTRVPTPTISPGATVGPVPTPTPPIISNPDEPTEVPDPTPTPNPDPQLFGPFEGSINLFENGPDIEQSSLGLDVFDFMIRATYVNPFSASSKNWTMGMWLRVQDGPGTFWTRGFPFPGTRTEGLLLYIESTGDWHLVYRVMLEAEQGSSFEDLPIQSGFVGTLATDTDEENNVVVTAFRDKGTLVINGDPVAELDLSLGPENGDIRLVTGLLLEDEFPGRVTGFHSTYVQEPDDVTDAVETMGLSSLSPNQSIKVLDSVTGDFVFDGMFPVTTPAFAGPWSWRAVLSSELQEVSITIKSDQTASVVSELFEVEGQAASVTGISTGFTPITVTQGESNDLSLVSIEGKLGIILNGIVLPAGDIYLLDAVDLKISAFVDGEAGSTNAEVVVDKLQTWVPASNG